MDKVQQVSFKVTSRELEDQGYELWCVIPQASDWKPVDAIKEAKKKEGYTHIIIRRISNWGKISTQIWGKVNCIYPEAYNNLNE